MKPLALSAMREKLASAYPAAPLSPVGGAGERDGVALADQPLPDHPIVPLAKLLGATGLGAGAGIGAGLLVDAANRRFHGGLNVPGPALGRVYPALGMAGAGAGALMGLVQQDTMANIHYNSARRREILEARRIRDSARKGEPAK